MQIDGIGVCARQSQNVLIAADHLDALTPNGHGLCYTVFGAGSKNLAAMQDDVGLSGLY